MKAKINGAEITYEDAGCGPAVLVLHDGPSSRSLRDHFAPLAEAGYRLILTSLRGPGGEPATGDGLGSRTEDAVALLNYLGIGRAVVIGVSRGGYVLLELMERHPGRVAAGSFVVSAAMARQMQQRAGRPEVRAALQQGGIAALREALLTTAPGRRPGWGRLRALQRPLGRLLDALVPRDEALEEEEVLSGPA